MSVRDRFVRWLLLPAALLIVAVPAMALVADPAQAPDGAALYRQRCASCHDNPDPSTRAPAKAALAARTPNEIFDTIAHGAMAPMAAGLSDTQLDALVVHIAGKAPVHAAAAAADPDAAIACKGSAPPDLKGPQWNGWSPTVDNARFQAKGLKARDVPRLKVKWALAFPGGIGSQPTVMGGRVYLGAGGGRVYALDAKTGCIHWRAEIAAGVRAALNVGPLTGPSGGPGTLAVFAGDRKGGVHALDAATGRELWATAVTTHPFGMITGSPVLHGGRLYVPVSSGEEISTFVKGYRCCTFRGSIAALDASNGKLLWQTYTIDAEPKAFRTAKDGGPVLGPAGAAIWSAPTIDPKRGALYVATGDSYTDVVETGSDAIIAMDLLTGAIRWSHQVTEGDNYLVGCTGAANQPAACPEKVGPDHDFGASPILRELPGGRTVLMTGQKSGEVTTLDPDRKGAMLWQTKVGTGGPLGGIEWGMASDRDLVFVPIADPVVVQGKGKGGMYALRARDGSLAWSNPAPDPDCAVAPKGSMIFICTSGLSAAATAIDGLVIAGSMDGILRAYDRRDGKVVWSFNVGQTSFQPLNAAAPMKGNTMNAGGATVAGDALFQVSGYQNANPRATNLLLAFTVDGK